MRRASSTSSRESFSARRVRGPRARTRSSLNRRSSASPVQISSEEDIQREYEETIRTWTSSLPDSVDLNALARWSHSAGHVDANMAKVPTLYALHGGHPKGTSAYIMRIGVRLAKNGSAMDGRTAINVLIAVMRALRASGTENLQPDVLREVHRRKACELPVSPYGNPRFGRG